MIAITYISSATVLFTEEELLQLLLKSRKTNEKNGITGMLLHKDGNFIQVLEGPEETVNAVYNKICRDGRHHGIIKLLHEKIFRRSFDQWSMAFHNLNVRDAKELEGFSEFLEKPLTSLFCEQGPSTAQKLLLSLHHKFS